eukprot:398777_1
MSYPTNSYVNQHRHTNIVQLRGIRCILLVNGSIDINGYNWLWSFYSIMLGSIVSVVALLIIEAESFVLFTVLKLYPTFQVIHMHMHIHYQDMN